MLSCTSFTLAVLVSLTQAHLNLMDIQGLPGSNHSVGFGIDPGMGRNCTLINACQLDTTIIRDAEIDANLVNLCGRNQLIGNIDIAYHTEAALAAGTVTQVKRGSELVIQMHQVNADGAGPYECDIDEGSNSSLMVKKLTMVSNVPGVNGVSQAMVKDFNITAKMPDDFTCYGASPGNICTIRCRNNAVAGPFGGCFAVQQIDVEPSVNTASSIKTFKDGAGIVKQIKGNIQDLELGKQANQHQGILDKELEQAHANKQLLAEIKTNEYPTTSMLAQAVGGAAAAQATTAPAAPVNTPSGALLASPAAPTTSAAASARPTPGAGGSRQGGQRPHHGGNAGGANGAGGATNNAGKANGAGKAAGAGANPFPSPNRNNNNNNNNKRSPTNGMRWARRFYSM